MDKLHVYTTVWNEAYMIKYFLRYYETVADRIFVIDDNSDDGTRDVIKSCSKATLLEYPFKSGFSEIEKTLCLSTEYREHSRDAEWVICVDCDEFIYHPNLRDHLDLRRQQGYNALKTTGYFFLSEEIPDTDGQLFDAMPYTFRKSSWDKEVVFDPKLDVNFTPGGHPPTPFPPGTRMIRKGLALYHCCYLSKQWIADHLKLRLQRMIDPKERESFKVNLAHFTQKAWKIYDATIKEGKERCKILQ